MNPFIWLLLEIISIYRWVLIATIVLSWLLAFNIINYGNQFVRQVDQVLRVLTEPVLAPIRRILPSISGLDFSPIVLFILLAFLEQAVIYYLLPLMQ
ncbi:YggT family protein [Aestuariivirga litoralis]|uniref:YggT family protein n=1 Tax=Aestuariivirga litoralis TaxID=2650924 RepID=UPI0018C6F756|nr:YggT family protein [Aestuariivirga litoralis]MBG1233519.1 YggT family protein [Aestuariivirga litoralis]